MQILDFEPDMAVDIAQAYNRAVEPVPHCYPVTADQFAVELEPALSEGQSKDGLHSNRVLVCREAGETLGFVHMATGRLRESDQQETGFLRFFWYAPGHRSIGQALLAAAEAHLRQHETDRIEAFSQYHIYPFYYFKPAYLSGRIGHVHALLTFNGYSRHRGEVFLDWPDFQPLEPGLPDIPAEVSLERKQGRARLPGVIVTAHREDREIGQCVCESVGDYHSVEEAQDWVMTIQLHVEERSQGRGLGRHLLQTALKEAHRLGYRHAVISNAWGNDRAFLFYANHGYHVVDWTYGYGRDL